MYLPSEQGKVLFQSEPYVSVLKQRRVQVELLECRLGKVIKKEELKYVRR